MEFSKYSVILKLIVKASKYLPSFDNIPQYVFYRTYDFYLMET